MLRTLFWTALVGTLLIGGAEAQAADQCFSSLPKHRSGYWRYKYVNHEKCWFGPGARHEDEAAINPIVASRQARRAPVPIPPLPVEEERGPDPSPSAVTRAKIIYISNPPTVSRRISQTFETLVTRCQDDVRACQLLTGD